jgi:hypothetical protein
MTRDTGIDEGFAIHYHPVRLLVDYNVAERRVRVLILVTTLVAPVMVQKLRSSG